MRYFSSVFCFVFFVLDIFQSSLLLLLPLLKWFMQFPRQNLSTGILCLVLEFAVDILQKYDCAFSMGVKCF